MLAERGQEAAVLEPQEAQRVDRVRHGLPVGLGQLLGQALAEKAQDSLFPVAKQAEAVDHVGQVLARRPLTHEEPWEKC